MGAGGEITPKLPPLPDPYPVNSPVNIPWCIAASERVLSRKRGYIPISEVVVGEHVYGYSSTSQTFGFSSVVAIPHAPNNAQAVFIQVITESGRALRITADHLLLKISCSSTGGERG